MARIEVFRDDTCDQIVIADEGNVEICCIAKLDNGYEVITEDNERTPHRSLVRAVGRAVLDALETKGEI